MSINTNLSTGVTNSTQLPVNAKRYFATIEEMIDLGDNDQKAFGFYKGQIAFCQEAEKEYQWSEIDPTQVVLERPGLRPENYTYPSDAPADPNGNEYADKIFNWVEWRPDRGSDQGGDTPDTLPDGIVSGSVFWTGTGLNFDSTIIDYVLNGTRLLAIEQSVTLGVADPTNPRIDVVAVNTEGTLVVIPGTPAPTPIKPQILYASQLEVSNILVPAGATIPSQAAIEQVYDENVGSPAEWDGTVTGFTSPTDPGTIAFDDASDPDTGSVSIRATSAQEGTMIVFDRSGTFNIADFNSLAFRYKSAPSLSISGIDHTFSIRLLNGSTVVKQITIGRGQYGFDPFASANYVNVNIPIVDFANEARLSLVDGITISFTNDLNGQRNEQGMNFLVDNIRFVNGGNEDQPPVSQVSFLSLTDTPSQYAQPGAAVVVDETGTGLKFVAGGVNTFPKLVLEVVPAQINNYGSRPTNESVPGSSVIYAPEFIVGETYVNITEIDPGHDFSNVGYVSDGVPFVALAKQPNLVITGVTAGEFIQISNTGLIIEEVINTIGSYTICYGTRMARTVSGIDDADTFGGFDDPAIFLVFDDYVFTDLSTNFSREQDGDPTVQVANKRTLGLDDALLEINLPSNVHIPQIRLYTAEIISSPINYIFFEGSVAYNTKEELATALSVDANNVYSFEKKVLDGQEFICVMIIDQIDPANLPSCGFAKVYSYEQDNIAPFLDTIPVNAFFNDTNLKEWIFCQLPGASNAIQAVGASAFEGSIVEDVATVFREATSIGGSCMKDTPNHTKPIYMKQVTSIPDGAFKNCATKEIRFLQVTSIGVEAITNTGIASLELNNNVVTISGFAITDNLDLKQLLIYGAANIGNSAFSGNSACKTIYAPNIVSLGTNVFTGFPDNGFAEFPNALNADPNITFLQGKGWSITFV